MSDFFDLSQLAPHELAIWADNLLMTNDGLSEDTVQELMAMIIEGASYCLSEQRFQGYLDALCGHRAAGRMPYYDHRIYIDNLKKVPDSLSPSVLHLVNQVDAKLRAWFNR